MNLTDAQWSLLKSLLPLPRTGPGCRRRSARDPRAVLDGILWILRTGAPWHDLPPCYPPYQTCHRRFQRWVGDGTFGRLMRALARDLEARDDIDLEECFIDGTPWAQTQRRKVASRLPSGQVALTGRRARAAFRLLTRAALAPSGSSLSTIAVRPSLV